MPDPQSTCPLCGRADPPPWPVTHAPGLHRCPLCSFIFAPHTQSESPGHYDSTFGATNVHPTYERRHGAYVVRNRPRLESLLARLEPCRQSGRILDVGCSAAFFLSVARDMGWQPHGVEIAPWAADFSRNELGIPVFNGLLQDAAFPDGHFDAVFSSHVLEHISDPAALLAEMTRVLRPGGLHVSVVPTQFASPSWRLARRFIGDPPPIHASFYTRETFARFLSRAGLKVTSIRYNLELSRLRDLLRSESAAVAAWRRQKDSTLHAADSPHSRPWWVSPAKYLANLAGNLLGLGDELVAVAQKPSA